MSSDDRVVDQWWHEQPLERRLSIYRWLNKDGPAPVECVGQLEIPIRTPRKASTR